MIKKEKMKTSNLEKSPYIYYVTNWGFMKYCSKKSNIESKQPKEEEGD